MVQGHSVAERPLQIDLILRRYFPCQDIISVSLQARGIDVTARSGLWSEYARIIGEVRPRYVLIENVSAMLGRGLARVLGDLAALGYDAEWHAIPASAVGAPHRRDRLWIVAYAARNVQPEQTARGPERQRAGPRGESILVAEAIGPGLEGRPRFGGYLAEQLAAVERGGEVPDAAGAGWDTARAERSGEAGSPGSFREPSRSDWWQSEPAMGQLVDGVSGRLVRFDGRVATGVKDRVSKLRALGNAVVPQIPEMIGRAILAHEVAA